MGRLTSDQHEFESLAKALIFFVFITGGILLLVYYCIVKRGLFASGFEQRDIAIVLVVSAAFKMRKIYGASIRRICFS